MLLGTADLSLIPNISQPAGNMLVFWRTLVKKAGVNKVNPVVNMQW